MNESSQQRLDEFRAGYRHARPGARLFSWLQILLILLGFAAVVAVLFVRAGSVRGTPANGGLEPDAQRQLAAYLAEKKAYVPALDAYDQYLAQAPLHSEERAKVCLAAAKVAIEGEQFERALALLYEAEWLKPGQELQREIDAAILTSLEYLGRGAELRSELRARAQIGRSPGEVASGDVVLAELADRVITERDLDRALEKLPAAARDALAAPEKKTDFLKNMVAEHLLAEKARRQELDKDPEIQAMLSDQLNTLMVRKLLQEEVESKVQIVPEDVERYYKAEQQRFSLPASAIVKVAQRDAGDEAPLVFGEKTVTVKDGVPAAGLAGGAAAVTAILALDPGQHTEPFVAEAGKETIYEVVSKTPSRALPFEEIRGQVERELRQKKEQEQIQTLIQSLLQTHNVRLYPERLQEPPL